MKPIFSLFALGALSACVAAAQTTASGQAGASIKAQAGAQANSTSKASPSSAAAVKKPANAVTIADGTKIDVKLVSWLDARRSRVGDPVEARIEQDVKQGGKVVLKKGTQLGGRVTVSQPRAGSQESQIGIAFERALLPNGISVPLHASIVAVAAAPSSTAGADSTMSAVPASARASAAQPAGAAVNTSNAPASSASGTTNAAAHSFDGAASPARLSSNSRGVIGLQGLSLGSAKPGTQGSVMASTTKNVRLNSGTEMMLRTSAQAQ